MLKALELLLYELSFSIVCLPSLHLRAFKYLTLKQVLDLSQVTLMEFSLVEFIIACNFSTFVFETGS